MKKVILLGMHVSLVVAACKKENSDEQSQNNPDTNNFDTTTVDTSSTYLASECGVSWNTDIQFGTVSDIDGNQYKTVTIGNQEWMAENLAVTKYNNGDTITFNMNVAMPAYAWAIDTAGECLKDCYGNQYNGYVLLDTTRNVCPTGWHVPSVGEWEVLDDYVSANYPNSVEYNLKSVEGWGHSTSSTGQIISENGQGGQDRLGFRLLPAGKGGWLTIDDFGEHGDAYMWTSTIYGINNMRAKHTYGTLWNEAQTAAGGSFHSIRCIKD